jgi:hypothetical protein
MSIWLKYKINKLKLTSTEDKRNLVSTQLTPRACPGRVPLTSPLHESMIEISG